MSVIENGRLAQTSVSQLERFDPEQFGGCPRKWWFEYVHALRPDQGEAAKAGDAGHLLFASYFRTGAAPTGRVKMGKAVTAAILKSELPKPGPDMLVEWRGDGQEKFRMGEFGVLCECGHDENFHGSKTTPAPCTHGCGCAEFRPAWIPLDRERTLKIAGIPFELFVDLTYRRGDVPHVLDHKFKGDLENIKARDELIRTIQMPVYVLARLPFWPDAKRWRLTHNNVCRNAQQGSKIVTTVVELDQVLERREQIETLVTQMTQIATVTNQDDVPVNPSRSRSCEAWGGCPHQSICSHFKRRDHVYLTPEEEANLLGGTPPAKVDDAESLFNEEPPPAAAAPAPAEDEEAKLEREFAARKAKLAADKKAKADAEAAAAKAKAEAEAKAAAEPKKRALLITGPNGAPLSDLPPPEAKPAAETWPACGCGTQLAPENASRLRDGSVKHISCPKDAPPTPTSEVKRGAGRPPKGSGTVQPFPASGELTINVKIDPESLAALRALLGK